MRFPNWFRSRKRRAPTAARRLFRPRLETLEDRCVPANISWDGGAATLNWHDAANWSTDQLPGLADDVTIDNATVSVTDNDVTVSGLSLLGGVLTGTADVTVSGLFRWTGGTLSGSGELNANGGMSLENVGQGARKLLNGRTLNNAAAAVWSGGHIIAYNGAVINNLAGATFDAQSGYDRRYEFLGLGGQGALATFNNAGTFRKSGETTPDSSGEYEIAYGTGMDLVFKNTGTVDVQVNALRLQNLGRDVGYVTTGDFVGAAGAWLDLRRGDLDSSAGIQAGHVALTNIATDGAFAAAGTTEAWNSVLFSGTSVSLGDLVVYGTADVSTDAPATATSLTILGGVLTGTADVTVSGLFRWTGGTLSGSGELNANGGMSLENVGQGARKLLNGRTLNNAAAAVWSGGHIIAYNGAVINNLAGATFDAQSGYDQRYEFLGLGGQGALATFNNAGTFRKSGETTPDSSGEYEIAYGTGMDLVFKNTGTVDVQVNALRLQNLGRDVGYVTTGDFVGAAGAWLDLRRGDLDSSAGIQAGHVALTNIATDGAFAAAGTTEAWNSVLFSGTSVSLGDLVVYGTADVSTDAPATATSLTIRPEGPGGELKGSADLDVSGLVRWIGGTLSGSGELNANGGMSLEGYRKFLNGRTLNNAATAAWSGGHIFAYNGAVINNLAGATFDAQSQYDLRYAFVDFGLGGQGARVTFNNAGTFRKTGETPIDADYDLAGGTGMDLVFKNTGTVDVQVGGLGLINLGRDVGYVTTGDFVGAAGAWLDLRRGDLDSSADIQAGHVALTNIATDGAFAAAGTTEAWNSVLFSGTSVSLGDLVVYGTADVSTDAPATATSLTIRPEGPGGELKGSADLDVSGLVRWIGGTLSGSGELNANGGMSLEGYRKFLNGRTLNNAATAAWSGGHIFAYNGAVINNLAGATFDAQSGYDLRYAFVDFGLGGQGALATFNNAGTFRKTGEAPLDDYDLGYGTAMELVFQNTGTVDAQVDAISFTSYTQTNGTTLLNDGAIRAPLLNLQGGSLAGAGQVFGPVNAAGQVSPGFSTGVILVHGNYSQANSGALVIELGGLTPGLGSGRHDQLDVRGTVNLAGALNVSLINSFSSALGDQFVIVQNDGTDAIVGTFTGLAEGARFVVQGRQYEISYKGTDCNGNDVVLTDVNVPPVADAGGPYTVVRGGTVQLDASATFDQNEPNSGLTYEWDFDGDGYYDDATGIAPVFSAEGLVTAETLVVGLRVTDSGCLQDTDTANVQVIIVGLIDDPFEAGKKALAIGGTLGDDTILFNPGGSGGSVQVKLNGVSQGTFSPTGHLIAYGQDGNDDIQVAGGISLPTMLFGGKGDDRLKGGAVNNILVGGDGDDLLVGGNSRDIMIGGNGADRIVGNGQDDVLIAGRTAFDRDLQGLCALMAEWASNRDYATRLDNLMGLGSGTSYANRLNGNRFLTAGSTAANATVFDDGSLDVLTGSSGQDWFWANCVGTGVLDKITDLSASEFANDLDFINAT